MSCTCGHIIQFLITLLKKYHDINQIPSPNKREKLQGGFSVITDVHNVVRLMDCTKILTVAMAHFEMLWKENGFSAKLCENI